MFFELAGRHRKLGVPWPPAARKTAPTGPASRLPPYALIRRAPPGPTRGSDPPLPETRSAEKGAGQDTRALGVQREGAGGRPTQKLGASNLDQDALLFLGECRSDGLELLGYSRSQGARNLNRP